MDFAQLSLTLAAAAAAGFLSVLAGGGSLLSISALMLLGMDGATANGSNRVAVCAQNVAAIMAFRRGGFQDFRLSLSLALCALPGAAAGAVFGARLASGYNYILAAVMIAVMILMAAPSGNTDGGTDKPRNLVLGHALTAAAGVYGGFIQAGVGFILMPILHKAMGLDLVRTNAYKIFIVLVYMPVSLAAYALNGKVDWWAGAVLAAGMSIGGWVGARLSLGKGEKLIRPVLYASLTAMTVRLLQGV